MHTVFHSLIQHVLTWLHGITSEQWAWAITFAQQAETEFTGNDTGVQKRQFVLDALLTQWPDLKSAALNTLVELAAGFIKKD